MEEGRKVFDAGYFHVIEAFYNFLQSDTLYEHRAVLFKCDRTIRVPVYEVLLEMGKDRCFTIEAAKESGFDAIFLLTGINRSALEARDNKSSFLDAVENAGQKFPPAERLEFNQKTSEIFSRSGKCSFQPETLEAALCMYMCSKNIGDLVDYSEFLGYYSGDGDIYEEKSSDEKKVRDAINRINKKIQEAFNTADLFLQYQRKHLKRNF